MFFFVLLSAIRTLCLKVRRSSKQSSRYNYHCDAKSGKVQFLGYYVECFKQSGSLRPGRTCWREKSIKQQQQYWMTRVLAVNIVQTTGVVLILVQVVRWLSSRGSSYVLIQIHRPLVNKKPTMLIWVSSAPTATTGTRVATVVATHASNAWRPATLPGNGADK